MLNIPSALLRRLRKKPRSVIGLGALIAITLGVGTIAVIDNKRDDSIFSAVAISKAAASITSGMSINQFLAAVRTMRILPGERTWWHRKGDKAPAPKAFSAIAPPENPAADVAPPPIVSPVAFAAIAPESGLGNSDLIPGPDLPGIGLPTPGGPGGDGPIIIRPTVSPPSSVVPEPATWALMIMGFGIIGARMRRQLARKAAGRFVQSNLN